jgi:hypothetical protein
VSLPQGAVDDIFQPIPARAADFDHVIQSHTAGGFIFINAANTTEPKSQWLTLGIFPMGGAEVFNLIQAAASTAPQFLPFQARAVRVQEAWLFVGTDARNGGQLTRKYTVVTQQGRLVTAYPGG